MQVKNHLYWSSETATFMYATKYQACVQHQMQIMNLLPFDCTKSEILAFDQYVIALDSNAFDSNQMLNNMHC